MSLGSELPSRVPAGPLLRRAFLLRSLHARIFGGRRESPEDRSKHKCRELLPSSISTRFGVVTCVFLLFYFRSPKLLIYLPVRSTPRPDRGVHRKVIPHALTTVIWRSRFPIRAQGICVEPEDRLTNPIERGGYLEIRRCPRWTLTIVPGPGASVPASPSASFGDIGYAHCCINSKQLANSSNRRDTASFTRVN